MRNKTILIVLLYLLSSHTTVRSQIVPALKSRQDSTYFDSNQFPLLHSEQTFKTKLYRGFAYSLIYNGVMGAYLLTMPDYITNWHKQDKFKLNVMLSQYERSFTASPVIDNDLFIVNYLGHPYQGSFYFNTLRSQGATFWQSAFNNFCQSMIWEYVWEGGLEQPSIQDMIVTPVIGSLVGELTHSATLSMRKNGYRWYEKIAVCVINPAFVMNNGFPKKVSIPQGL